MPSVTRNQAKANNITLLCPPKRDPLVPNISLKQFLIEEKLKYQYALSMPVLTRSQRKQKNIKLIIPEPDFKIVL
jgi:hypothetical protein